MIKHLMMKANTSVDVCPPCLLSSDSNDIVYELFPPRLPGQVDVLDLCAELRQVPRPHPAARLPPVPQATPGYEFILFFVLFTISTDLAAGLAPLSTSQHSMAGEVSSTPSPDLGHSFHLSSPLYPLPSLPGGQGVMGARHAPVAPLPTARAAGLPCTPHHSSPTPGGHLC